MCVGGRGYRLSPRQYNTTYPHHNTHTYTIPSLHPHLYNPPLGEQGDLPTILADHLRPAAIAEYEQQLRVVFTAGTEARRRRSQLAKQSLEHAHQRYVKEEEEDYHNVCDDIHDDVYDDDTPSIRICYIHIHTHFPHPHVLNTPNMHPFRFSLYMRGVSIAQTDTAQADSGSTAQADTTQVYSTLSQLLARHLNKTVGTEMTTWLLRYMVG